MSTVIGHFFLCNYHGLRREIYLFFGTENFLSIKVSVDTQAVDLRMYFVSTFDRVKRRRTFCPCIESSMR